MRLKEKEIERKKMKKGCGKINIDKKKNERKEFCENIKNIYKKTLWEKNWRIYTNWNKW